MQKNDHSIGFKEKHQFFRRKFAKIANNWQQSPNIGENRRKFSKIDGNLRKSPKIVDIAEHWRKSPKIAIVTLTPEPHLRHKLVREGRDLVDALAVGRLELLVTLPVTVRAGYLGWRARVHIVRANPGFGIAYTEPKCQFFNQFQNLKLARSKFGVNKFIPFSFATGKFSTCYQFMNRPLYL
jgi:hypothetical protein